MGQAKGLAVEINIKEDYVHHMIGISHINLKSVGECCCKLAPRPNLHETLFLSAGNDADLDEKTFHYLSGSLFDVPDETNSPSKSEPALISTDILVNPDTGILTESADTILSGNTNQNSKDQLDDMINNGTESVSSVTMPVSRDKNGCLDENYGHTRFGAIFIDGLFTSANLNKTMKNKLGGSTSSLDALDKEEDISDADKNRLGYCKKLIQKCN